jgi:hypothetical protein
MSAAATPAEPTPPADPAASDDAYVRETIRALIDAGTRLVQDLVAEPTPASTKAEPYERIARAVRRSVLLARHIAENPVRTPAHRRAQARKQIIRAVEDTIDREARNPPRAETLRRELRERLDAPDLEDDIADRPIEDVIAEIRHDLGLGNPLGGRPYPRRTPAALHALAALAAAPTGAASRPPFSLPPGPNPAQPDEHDPAQPDDDDHPGGHALPYTLLATLLAGPPHIRPRTRDD